MKKVFTVFIILILAGVVYRFNSSPISSASRETSIQMQQLNTCEISADCSLMYGSVNTRCYYLINSNNIEKAITILKSTGEIVDGCNELETSSGVTCLQKTCVLGEGPMSQPIKW